LAKNHVNVGISEANQATNERLTHEIIKWLKTNAHVGGYHQNTRQQFIWVCGVAYYPFNLLHHNNLLKGLYFTGKMY